MIFKNNAGLVNLSCLAYPNYHKIDIICAQEPTVRRPVKHVQ